MRRVAWLAALAVGVSTAGCGAASAPAPVSRATTVADLASSPPQLRRLHERAGRVFDSDPTVFAGLLRRLRGHPVVINEWASWCPSCGFEMSVVQAASLRWGRRVAFVGVDEGDLKSSAHLFIRRHPMSYPSYFDPHEAIARSLHGFGYYPQTIYVDAAGRITFRHLGSYGTVPDISADIRRYALD